MEKEVPVESLLANLEAERAIQRLIYRYSIVLDTGDVDTYADLFEPDGRVEIQSAFTNRFGGKHAIPWEEYCLANGGVRTERAIVFQGRDLLRRFSTPLPGTNHSLHFVSQPLVTVDLPATASAVSYMSMSVQQPGALPVVQVIGRYLDSFRKTAEGWRFVTRVCEV